MRTCHTGVSPQHARTSLLYGYVAYASCACTAVAIRAVQALHGASTWRALVRAPLLRQSRLRTSVQVCAGTCTGVDTAARSRGVADDVREYGLCTGAYARECVYGAIRTAFLCPAFIVGAFNVGDFTGYGHLLPTGRYGAGVLRAVQAWAAWRISRPHPPEPTTGAVPTRGPVAPPFVGGRTFRGPPVPRGLSRLAPQRGPRHTVGVLFSFRLPVCTDGRIGACGGLWL